MTSHDEEADIRSLILDAKDIKEEELTIPEWGGVTVILRELNGAERAEILNSSLRKDGLPDLTKLYPLLVIKSLRYPRGSKKAGEHIFKAADRDSISLKSGGVIERIGLASMRLSGMAEEVRDDIAKNSEATQNEDSTSS